MNLKQNSFQPELEVGYYGEPETDVRRDPNHILLLFLIIVLLFVGALAAIFISNGKLMFLE